MNAEPDGNGGQEEMHKAVRLREKRRDEWRKKGERSLWQNVSMIGALGWLIVMPPLIGVLIGRWLDRAFGTGIMFAGALIFLGVALGGYLAWQRIDKA